MASGVAGGGRAPDRRFRDVVTDPRRALMYRKAGMWTDATLAGRVERQSRRDGGKVAVIDRNGDRSRTYLELHADSAKLAQYLRDQGVVPGDVVSAQLPNVYEAVVVAVAAQATGAVLNPLVPGYRANELRHILRTAAPKVLVTPGVYHGWDYRAMVGALDPAGGARPLHIVVDDTEQGGDKALGEILGQPGRGQRLAPAAASAALVSELIFTSGTEAAPKAIMHTEETANAGVNAVFADLAIDQGQVLWMPSPVGHSAGFNFGLRAALIRGHTLVLQDPWSADAAIELIQRYNCSYTLAAPTFLQDLVAECQRTGTRLPQLSHFGCGGAAVPPQLVDDADDLGIRALRLYGSTEVLCATWNRPWFGLRERRRSDGVALTNVDLELRDESGGPVTWPGEGELYVRGPSASVGFFADSERTAATYVGEGWVRSGDFATLDPGGHLTIAGRKKEIIIRGGANISPREVEDLIMTFAEVQRVAVIGVPDERLGERSCACIVPSPGCTLDLPTLVSRLRRLGLATYKLPEQLVLVNELPLTASGKIQKYQLVNQIGAPQ